MEFRILGPIEVLDEERPLALGGRKQRAVLAHLILQANRIVPADLLIDDLWGAGPPETARNTLQTYVYRLRRLLGDGRIEGRSGGYVLSAAPEEIDAARFEALVRGAKAVAESDPAGAAATLADALSLLRSASIDRIRPARGCGPRRPPSQPPNAGPTRGRAVSVRRWRI
jgi:DNA-binding SARP family transcriptional activator